MKNWAQEWLTMLWFLLAVVILKPSCIFLSTYMKLLFPKQTKFRVPGSFSSESSVVWCNRKCIFLRNFVYSQTSSKKSVRGKVVNCFFDQEEYQMWFYIFSHAFVNTFPSFVLIFIASFIFALLQNILPFSTIHTTQDCFQQTFQGLQLSIMEREIFFSFSFPFSIFIYFD